MGALRSLLGKKARWLGKPRPSCMEAWMRDTIRDVQDAPPGDAGRFEPWLRRGGMGARLQADMMEPGMGLGEAMVGVSPVEVDDAWYAPGFAELVRLHGSDRLGPAGGSDVREQLATIGRELDKLDDEVTANTVLDVLTGVVGAHAAMAAVPGIVRSLGPVLRLHRATALQACVTAIEVMGLRLDATEQDLAGKRQQLGDVIDAAAAREQVLVGELSVLRALGAKGPLPRVPLVDVGPGLAALAARVPALFEVGKGPVPLAAAAILRELVELHERPVVVEGPWTRPKPELPAGLVIQEPVAETRGSPAVGGVDP